MAKVVVKRAFQLSLIPMFAEIFITFLNQYPTAESISADIPNFVYNLIKSAGATYFVTLCGVLGISKYLEFEVNRDQ
jgi:hypothetical protein